MNRINRRDLMVLGTGGIASSVGAAHDLFAANEAHAQPRAPTWPNMRLLDRLKILHPIVQAPMAGFAGADMAVAVSGAGGLGSLPCGLLTPAQVRDEVAKIQAATSKPINLNFFCHAPPQRDEAVENAWRQRLAPYYTELGIDAPASPSRTPAPFGAEMCDVVVELKPAVVSFTFGLPEQSLIDRVKATGCMIFGSATTVAEAKYLEDHGVEAIVAQGNEAGGNRTMFLTSELTSQLGTLALVPHVVDAVRVPVIAAGGIGDGRGIAAAMALGAAAVQMGTAYLLCPEARVSAPHRAALKSARENQTVITNVLTGRPARVFRNRIVRELGPMATAIPAFPLPAAPLVPLRAKAEAKGSDDFTALYAGEAAALARERPAADLTLQLAAEAHAKIFLRVVITP